MNRDETPRKRLLDRMFEGNSRTAREEKVREYIVHRIHGCARVSDVLQEEYVRDNCNRDELDEIVRDPRLIREEREELRRVFEDGRLDPALARYVAEKGSVAVAGVSLTVTAVGPDWFGVSLIPTTLAETTLGDAAVGTRVNLEVDVLAKYVERLLSAGAVAGVAR